MIPTAPTKKFKEEIIPSTRSKTRNLFANYEFKSLGIFSILMFIFSFYMLLPILNVSIAAFNFSEPSNFFDNFFFVFNEGILLSPAT